MQVTSTTDDMQVTSTTDDTIIVTLTHYSFDSYDDKENTQRSEKKQHCNENFIHNIMKPHIVVLRKSPLHINS